MPAKGIKLKEMMQLKMPVGQNIASVYSCCVFCAIIIIFMALDWHDKAILMPGLGYVWFQCQWVSFGIKKECSLRGRIVGLVLG